MPSTRVRRGLYWSSTTKTWHYEFRYKLPGQPSRKYNGDTGHVLEQDAQDWKANFKADLKKKAVGMPVAVAPSTAPTLREGLAHWLAEANRAGARHREIVSGALKRHFASEMDQPIPELTKPVVDRAVARYLAGSHRGKRHTDGGANVLLRALKCVVNHERKAGRIDRVPFEQVSLLEPQPRPRMAPTAEDLDRLMKTFAEIQAPQQARDLALLIAGLGLRVSESCTARVEAFDPRRKVFTPWDPLVGTKGHTAVQLPVPSWVMPHLVRLAGDRKQGYLVKGARSERTSRTLVWRWVAKARVLLRWPWLCPHELRACYATLLSDEGVAPQVIQMLLRHKHLKTTERYLRHNMDTAREALERIGQKAGFTPLPPPAPAPPPQDLSPSSPRKFRIVKIKST